MPGIVGKVAQIMDEYTVVINRGRENGVEEGMRFIIYKLGDEIIDPDTKEPLGNFENVKLKVKVVNVSQKFSTAISDETIETPSSISLSSISRVISQTSSLPKELPLDSETRINLIRPRKEGVKIGDSVRQILD